MVSNFEPDSDELTDRSIRVDRTISIVDRDGDDGWFGWELVELYKLAINA